METADVKAKLRELKDEDFFEKVNLHIHTNCSDGKLTPREVIKLAEKKGLKYFSICDHNNLNAYTDEILSCENLITGIEFDCWYKGVFFHLLGYGIDVKSEYLKPFLAKNDKETKLDIVRIFAKRDVKKLIQAIHKSSGIAVLAHPACCITFNSEKFVKDLVDIGLDGIETRYPYKRHRRVFKFHSAKTVKLIAKKLNLIETGGTDAHGFEI